MFQCLHGRCQIHNSVRSRGAPGPLVAPPRRRRRRPGTRRGVAAPPSGPMTHYVRTGRPPPSAPAAPRMGAKMHASGINKENHRKRRILGTTNQQRISEVREESFCKCYVLACGWVRRGENNLHEIPNHRHLIRYFIDTARQRGEP